METNHIFLLHQKSRKINLELPTWIKDKMAIQMEKQNFQKVSHDRLREEVTILYDKCHNLKVDIAGWKELHEKSITSARAKEDIIKDLMMDNPKLTDKLVAS